MTIRRLAVLGVLVAAVTGGAVLLALKADERPEDASVTDFCAAYEIPIGTNTESSDRGVQETLGAWAERLRSVGSPSGIPAETRIGMEERIEWAEAAAEATSGEDPELATTPGQLRRMQAFEDYAETTCGGATR